MPTCNDLVRAIILLSNAAKNRNLEDVDPLLMRLQMLVASLRREVEKCSPEAKVHPRYLKAIMGCWIVDRQVRSLLGSLADEDNMSQDVVELNPVPASPVDSDDDDALALSDVAAAALQEFYSQQHAEEERLNLAYIGNVENFVPREDWQLSQFWYDDKTANVLAREALISAGNHGSIACVSSPTAYKRIRELRAPGVEVKCLEYDQRFQIYGEDFVLFDFNDPLNLDVSLKNRFDVVVVDPPFLSEDCLTKTAVAVRFLAKDKIILCTGAIMAELAFRLLQVRPSGFKPTHQNPLQNEFLCYTNYRSENLQDLH